MTVWHAVAEILADQAEGCVIVDAKRRIRIFGRGLERRLGWARHEVVGKSWIDLIPKEHQLAQQAQLAAAFKRRSSTLEVVVVGTTGEVIGLPFVVERLGRGGSAYLVMVLEQPSRDTRDDADVGREAKIRELVDDAELSQREEELVWHLLLGSSLSRR